MILVIGQNSTWQNTCNLPSLNPGAVNRIARVFASAAGKGANTVRALGLLGKEGRLLAYAGGPNGRKFMDACAVDGIASDFTTIERETRVCTTLIEDSGAVTELVEPAPAVAPAECKAFRDSFNRWIESASMVVISGTAMEGESPDCYLDQVRSAHAATIPALLDSYRSHGKRALEASREILKINAHELAATPGSRLPLRLSALPPAGGSWPITACGGSSSRWAAKGRKASTAHGRYPSLRRR